MSFTSDQLEEEEPTYDEAPWDVTTKHPKLGVLIVATAGTLLPHTTNYKGKPDCDTVVRFSVGQDLVVKIEKERIKPSSARVIPCSGWASLKGSSAGGLVGASPSPGTSTPSHRGPTSPASGPPPSREASRPPPSPAGSQLSSPSTVQREMLVTVNQGRFGGGPSWLENQDESEQDDGVSEEDLLEFSPSTQTKKSPKSRYRSSGEFLMNIDKHFEKIVIEGLESGLRASVLNKVQQSTARLQVEGALSNGPSTR